MRDPKRIKRILLLIEKIWEQAPDQRFCQLIYNLTYGLKNDRTDIFYIEDDEFENYIKILGGED